MEGCPLRVIVLAAVTLVLGACERRAGGSAPAPGAARAAPDSGEPAAYRALVDSLYGPTEARPVAVWDTPGTPWSLDAADAERRLRALADEWPELEPGTLAAFRAALAAGPAGWRDSVGLGSPVRWVGDSAGRALLGTPEGLRALPPAGRAGAGIVGLSRLGMNAARTQALAYVSLSCGPLCGSGRFVLLTRAPGGPWRVGRQWTAIAS